MNMTPRTYRIVRIADPRSRGACSWYEVEAIAADGARWHVATCDTRTEARELVRQIEAADAARAADQAAERPIDLQPFHPWAPPMPRADAGDLELQPLD